MDAKALVVALMAGASSDTAGPLDGIPPARTICAAISSESPVRALEGSAGQARAESADPAKRLALAYNSGRLYFIARDYPRVLNRYAALIEANPTSSRNWLAYFYRGLALSAQGDYQQALAEVSKAPPGPDGDAGAVANFARMQVLAGHRAAGEATLQLLLDRDARGKHVVAYQIAAAYEALGNRDQMFRWLARATEEVDGLGSWLLWFQHDPRWDRVRQDPRFVAIVAKARPPY
jgi:tetratricopeptide (TPR) repeat protein